jgi:hypothetical protein
MTISAGDKYLKANSKGRVYFNPINVYDILGIHKGNLKE